MKIETRFIFYQREKRAAYVIERAVANHFPVGDCLFLLSSSSKRGVGRQVLNLRIMLPMKTGGGWAIIRAGELLAAATPSPV